MLPAFARKGNLVDRAEELLDNLVITGVQNDTIVQIDVLRRSLERILSVRRSRNLGNDAETGSLLLTTAPNFGLFPS